MDFDFATYLTRFDPTYVYRVEKLTGGVVNVTARASKDGLSKIPLPAAPSRASPTLASRKSAELDCARGRFPGHGSLILKYAPPYIAGVGEGAPMSQSRQEVEAASLALFLPATLDGGRESGSLTNPSSSTAGVLHHVSAESGVMVPRLLHHDPAEHVLILSDLGPLPDLSKVFIELGGFTPDSGSAATSAAAAAGAPWRPPASSPGLGHALDTHEIGTFRSIGEKLGTFFARLHSPRSLQSVLGARYNQGGECKGEQNFPRDAFPSLPEMKTAIHDHVIKPIRSHLLKFPSLLDETEADTLFAAIEADFLRPTSPEEQCVVLGDCWTGAVLVDLDSSAGDTDADVDVDVDVGVIDWEFASISGRGVNGDVSQFLAHLELLRVAAHHTHPPGHAKGHLSAVNAIIEGFITQYHKLAQTEWRVGDDRAVLLHLRRRSAYLLHGAEIINCAFWKTWVCRDPACGFCTQNPRPAGAGDPGAAAQCSVVTSLVRRGVSFLRCAVSPDPSRGTARLRQDVANLELGSDTQTMGLYDLFEENPD